MTLRQKTDLLGGVCLVVSLSVLVFIRRRIGYRLLDSGWYLGAALAVYLLGVFNYDHSQPYPHAMEWYALAIVIFGACQRMAGWMLIRKGTQPHSYNTGLSIFETRRTLAFIRRNRLTNRLIDPAIVGLCGVVVKASVCDPLGNWLVFAAIALFFYEILAQHRAIERDLDIADSLAAAGVQAETVKHFDGGGGNRSVDGEEGAVPTGIGKDIRRKISRQ